MIDLNSLSREQLTAMVLDAAKLWLAHDGLWFQAVEQASGLDAAIARDAEAWELFTALEAKRIMARLSLPSGGGLDALAKALDHRLYALLNRQQTERVAPDRLVFRMNECRVQSARKRKGLPDFPCKPVGLVEYAGFARTIDPRIETRCLCCRPDDHPQDHVCAWEFTLRGSGRP
jgi:hypothetical protein